jgi:hypothetical protein
VRNLASRALLAIAVLGVIRLEMLAARQVPWQYPMLVLQYFVAPALVGGLAAVALFVKPSVRAAIARCFGAGAVALLVVEALLLREHGWYTPATHHPRPPGVAAWDDRSPLTVDLDLRSQGVTTYPFVERQRLELAYRTASAPGGVYPLAGVANVLTVYCNELGTFANFVSDRHGFNNPANVWDHPVDVALIGDSFAMGACVDTTETPAAQIRRVRPAISLGMNGNGPLSELAILREYAAQLAPRHVVWLYFPGNDFLDFDSERTGGFLNQYRSPGFRQSLISRQAEVDDMLRQFLDNEVKTDSARLRNAWRINAQQFLTLRRVRERLFPLLLADEARVALPCAADRLEQFTDLIEQARAEVEHWGGQFYFLYLPMWLTPVQACQPPRDALIASLERQGIAVIDVQALFDAEPDQRRLRPPEPGKVPGRHLTPAGYALVARAILDRLNGP